MKMTDQERIMLIQKLFTPAEIEILIKSLGMATDFIDVQALLDKFVDTHPDPDLVDDNRH